MVDQEGFLTLVKYLHKKPLTEKEKKFTSLFFNEESPKNIKLKINPSIKFEKKAPLVTATPTLIDLSLNNYCNLQCPYCYMSAKPLGKGENLSIENFNYLLDEMIKGRIMQIALGGGEPTLHPYFTVILRRLRVDGDIIPNYTTNGTNLTPEILKASKKYCGAIAVSYSEERERETLDAVKTLIEKGIQTNIHIVLVKSRLSKLSEIAEKYARLGINSVVLLLFKPMGRGTQLEDEVMTHNEKQEFSTELVKIIMLRKKYGIRLSIDACSAFSVKDFPFLPESIDGCTGGTYSAYIDWKLNMKPCSFMQNSEGVSVKERGFKEAWNSTLFTEFRNTILNPRYEGCNTCKFFSSCWGGCPIRPDIVFCKEKGKKIENEKIKGVA